MPTKATTVTEYLNALPEDRKVAVNKLREQILDNLPKGVVEHISYGMLGYVIPHTVYPSGYHCDTKLPLPFMNLANQKNFIAVYSMVLYAKPDLMDWFVTEYSKRCKYKLDMGKSCVRFKKMEDIPYDLIEELLGKMSVEEWIGVYESAIKK